MLRSGFFPENALGDGPAFRIFPGCPDKGSLGLKYEEIPSLNQMDQTDPISLAVGCRMRVCKRASWLDVKIGFCYGSSGHLNVDVCQVEIVNRVNDIFSLEYEEYDFNTLLQVCES